MEDLLVTREVLEIYDRYHGDFGLLDERWSPEEDRRKLSSWQARALAEYIEKLHLTQLDTYSAEMREDAWRRIAELEKLMDPKVAGILRERVLGE